MSLPYLLHWAISTLEQVARISNSTAQIVKAVKVNTYQTCYVYAQSTNFVTFNNSDFERYTEVLGTSYGGKPKI